MTCLYSWNPTIDRIIGFNALPTTEACPCDYGEHLVDYTCTVNQPSQSPTTIPLGNQPGPIVGIVVGGLFVISTVVYICLRLLKRKKYKQFKVVPINYDIQKSDSNGNNDLGKFDSPTQYFKLGSVEDYQVMDL